MNEVEYVLRIVLQARDELAKALRAARNELRDFARDAESNQGKINAFNDAMERMDKNIGSITDKFRAWRAVITGVGDDSDDSKKSMADLNKEVEKTVSTTAKAAKSTDDLRKAASALRSEYKEIEKLRKDEKISLDQAIDRYKAISTQLEKFSRQSSATSRDAARFWDWSRQAKDAVKSLEFMEKANKDFWKNQIKAEADATKESNRLATERENFNTRLAEKTFANVERLRDAKRKAEKAEADEAKRLAKEREDFTLNLIQKTFQNVERLRNAKHAAEKAEEDESRRRAEEHARWTEGLAIKVFKAADKLRQDRRKAEQAAADELIKIEIEKAEKQEKLWDRQRAQYKAFVDQRAALDRLGSSDAGFIDVKRAQETVKAMKDVAKTYKDTDKSFRDLMDGAYTLEHAISSVNRTLRTSGRDADKAEGSFRKLLKSWGDNRQSVAAFDNQMRGLGILLLVGFAQQLVTALTALGGAFVSVAGSAAMAGSAIGGIFVAGIAQALPAIGLLGAALVRVKGVMDAVQQAQLAEQQGAVQAATAHRRVADAADTLREAQERLREARKEAKNELEDLIQAERDAELAAAGAALSQEEAQESLREAIATGGDVRAAQLRVLEANAQAEKAVEDRRRARQESRQGQAVGPEGMPGVVQAQQQLETAKRNAQEAAAGTETAVARLNYMLAQLSPAERRMYEAVTRFQELFRGGVYREITDNLVNSFARSVEKITDIIQMPQVISLARKTSETLANQMNRIFDAFTSDKMLDQFTRIGEEGRKNLQPLSTIIIRVGRSLANIAEAAGPALRNLLEFVKDLVGEFEKLTGNRQKMTAFFEEGEKHFEAWVKLGLAVIELFAALTGAGGAASGMTLIENATKAIDDLTEKVRDNKGDVAEFFEDARKVVESFASVLEPLGEQIMRVFTPENAEKFVTLLKDVVIPAIGDLMVFISNFTGILLEVSESPIGSFLLRMIVGFVVFSKIVGATIGAFVDFAKAVGFVFKPVGDLLKMIAVAEGKGAVLGRLKTVFEFFTKGGGLRVVKGVGIVGGILLLLDALGLLDDAWREVKSAFEAFWEEVGPSIEDLVAQFKDLWDVVSEGEGLFGILADVLRPFVKALITVGGIILRVFGRWLGRVIGGAIDVLSGLIQFLTGVFTGDWEKAWEGVKKIFRGIWRAITAPFRAIPDLIKEAAENILPALKEGFSAVWEWLKDLPDKIGDLIADIEFGSIGESIINSIVDGIKAAPEIIGEALEWLIDQLPIPGFFKGKAKDALGLKDGGPVRRAVGGGIDGYGGGDIVSALLEPGEHVWTKEEVRRAGGHAAMFAMRARFGGGKQSYGGRFRDGGAADGGGEGSLVIAFQGGDLQSFAQAWREFWEFLQLIALRGATLVAAQFREMRVATARSADRMYRDVRGSLADMERSFEARGKRIVNSWSDMWMSVKKTTHEALVYIGHETNQALRGLDEQHVDFGFTPPKKADGKAGGGWIGRRGERGRDRGFYPLGAGEAVLNWQHQAYVEPAMNAYYGHGLTAMFDRVHGYHAGGGGSGFASGSAAIVPVPGFPGERAAKKILDEIAYYTQKFGLALTDAFGPGHQSPGHTVYGTAADIAGSDISMNRAAADMVQKGYKVLYHAGTVPGTVSWPGHGPSTVAGSNAHIHVEFGSKDGNVAGYSTASDIQKGRVTGPEGALKAIVEKIISVVTKSANAYIDQFAVDFSTEGQEYQNIEGGGSVAKVLASVWRAMNLPFLALLSAIETGIVETGLQNLPGGHADSVGWRQERSHYGSQAERMNVSHGAQRFYREWQQFADPGESAGVIAAQVQRPAAAYIGRYDSAQSAALRVIKQLGIDIGEYARGGEIPGGEGMPVPILAHAREWIVNPLQQSRLAALTGMTREGLKSVLGFYGGPGGAAGGTEVGEVTLMSRADVKGIDDRKLRRLVVALRKLGSDLDKILPAMQPAETFIRRLDRTMDSLKSLSVRINEVDKPDKRKGVRAFLDRVEKLTGDTGLFAQLREAIERRTERFARRIQRSRLVAGGTAAARTFSRLRGGETEQDATRREAEQDLVEQQRQRGDLVAERAAIARQLAQVRRQQKRKNLTELQRKRLQTQENILEASLDESRQRVVDNSQGIFEAQEAVAQAVAAQQEAIIEGLRNDAEKINTATQRRLTGLDLAGRMLDALGVVGLTGAAAAGGLSRSGILAARGSELTSQRQDLLGVQARVAARGGEGSAELIAELQDEIDELTVAIAENSRALFDARVEDVNNRAAFGLTVADLNQQIIELGGIVDDNTEQQTVVATLTAKDTILRDKDRELRALLAEAQAKGDQQAVQDLTIAVKENYIATLQNTKALDEATGALTEPQTFASSAWSRFGEAIFNGMGQVLPQYNPGNMMGEVNTGAVVMPAGTSSTRISGDTNINIHEAGGPVNLEEVSSAVVWGSKVSQ